MAAKALSNSSGLRTETGSNFIPNASTATRNSASWGGVGGIIWIPKEGHTREGGNNLLEELQPFSSDLRAKDGVPSDIASGPGEARYEPGPHWIANSHHDDGDRRCRLLGREGRRRTERRDEVRGDGPARPRPTPADRAAHRRSDSRMRCFGLPDSLDQTARAGRRSKWASHR